MQIPADAPASPMPKADKTPVGLDTWFADGAFSVPCYKASSSDAEHRLLYSPQAWRMVARGLWSRSGNSPAVEAEILASARAKFPPPGNVFSSTSTSEWVLPGWIVTRKRADNEQFRFKPTMLPAAGADGHMAVAQLDGRVVETYATIMLSTGDVVALSTTVSDDEGLGDAHQNGQTASMLPDYAGLIVDGEIAGGIRHAMAITVPAGLLAPHTAYPAATFDRNAATGDPPYGGRLPMGGRLALPPTLDLASLGLVSAAGRAIAAAAQTYGFIAVDRGGSGITLRVQPNTAHSVPALHGWDASLQADLNAIFAHVEQVEVARSAP